MTLMVMTALKTLGSPLTPAYVIARTKGEAEVLDVEAPRSLSEPLGTMSPTMRIEMT